MANVQEAKKELLEACKLGVALFGDEKLPKDLKVMELNNKILRNLEQVLKEGSIKDQEEALKAFAGVLYAFKGVHNQIWGKFPSADAKALLKNNPYFGEKQFDELRKLEEDLLKLVETPTENG